MRLLNSVAMLALVTASCASAGIADVGITSLEKTAKANPERWPSAASPAAVSDSKTETEITPV